jgi:hypothetical protein
LGDGWIVQADALATKTTARKIVKEMLEDIGTTVIPL